MSDNQKLVGGLVVGLILWALFVRKPTPKQNVVVNQAAPPPQAASPGAQDAAGLLAGLGNLVAGSGKAVGGILSSANAPVTKTPAGPYVTEPATQTTALSDYGGGGANDQGPVSPDYPGF